MKAIICVLLAFAFGTFATAADSSSKKKNDNNTITSVVTFDVEIKSEDGGYEEEGKFVIGLFGRVCPMTVLNFESLAKGHKRDKKTLKYAKSIIHRVVRDFVIQMGDVTVGDGTGGESVFGATFSDENFILSHKAAGYVAMANTGKDSNGSQFYILLNKQRWLDNKHVVFGKVLAGMEFIRKIGEVPTHRDTAMPKGKITITNCQVEALKTDYELTDDESTSDNDIPAFKKYLNPKKK